MSRTSCTPSSPRGRIWARSLCMQPAEKEKGKVERQAYYDRSGHAQHLVVPWVVGDEIDGMSADGREMRLHVPREIHFRQESRRGDGEMRGHDPFDWQARSRRAKRKYGEDSHAHEVMGDAVPRRPVQQYVEHPQLRRAAVATTSTARLASAVLDRARSEANVHIVLLARCGRRFAPRERASPCRNVFYEQIRARAGKPRLSEARDVRVLRIEHLDILANDPAGERLESKTDQPSVPRITERNHRVDVGGASVDRTAR